MRARPESPPHPNPLPHEDVVEREFMASTFEVPKDRISGDILFSAAFPGRPSPKLPNKGGFLDTPGVLKATMLLESKM